MKNQLIISATIVIMLVACTQTITPKPREYFRITFPPKEYQRTTNNLPYSFEMAKYCHIEKEEARDAEKYWNNVVFDKFDAKIHLSFKYIKNNLDTLIDDSHTLAYKHTVKAEAISKKIFINDTTKVYALIYYIKGNVASPIQFFATDSTKHFLRGSLYFNTTPNKDSLAPVIDFVTDDIIKLVETIKWEF